MSCYGSWKDCDEIMRSGSFHAVLAMADLPLANSFWPSGRSDPSGACSVLFTWAIHSFLELFREHRLVAFHEVPFRVDQ